MLGLAHKNCPFLQTINIGIQNQYHVLLDPGANLLPHGPRSLEQPKGLWLTLVWRTWMLRWLPDPCLSLYPGKTVDIRSLMKGKCPTCNWRTVCHPWPRGLLSMAHHPVQEPAPALVRERWPDASALETGDELVGLDDRVGPYADPMEILAVLCGRAPTC